MSSDSSNPPSPRGVRPQNAGFHNSGMAPPGDSQSYFQQQPVQAPIVRQPIGFSSHAPSVGTVPTYAAGAPGAQVPQFHPGQGMSIDQPSQEHRKRRKHKDKDKLKAKPSRDRAPVDDSNYSTPIPYASPAPNASTPFLQPPAFRIPAYNHTPQVQSTAGAHPPPPPSGSYLPDHASESSSIRNKGSGTKSRSHRPEARMPAPSHSMNSQPPDSRSFQQNEFNEAYQRQAEHHSGNQPGYNAPPSASDAHQRSRSHRPREHRSNSTASNAPPQQYTAPSSSYAPQGMSPTSAEPPSRPKAVLRILTVLIEDKRFPEEEGQLAEVRVSLRPGDDPEDGYWADAREIAEELQSGPARIDGPAKVYTMRGKYRQYFLRVTADGVTDCQSSNLKVSKDRTLEVFVEHNPAALSGPPQYATPPPTVPTSVDGYSPSRSEFGNVEVASIPRKRRHSASSRSSVASALRTQAQVITEEHASHRSSPFTNRAPSLMPSQDPPLSPTPVASHDSPISESSIASPRLPASVSQQLSAFTTVFDQAGSRASSGSQHGSPMSTGSSLASPIPASPPLPEIRSSHPSQTPFTGHQSVHSMREQTASPISLPGPSSSKKARGPSGEPSARSADGGGSNHWGSRGSSTGSSTTTPATSGFAQFAQPVTFGAPSLVGPSQITASFTGRASPSSPSVSSPRRNIDQDVWLSLRDVFKKEPQFETFVTSKSQQVPLVDMLRDQYAYIKSKLDKYLDKPIPVTFNEPGGKYTRAQILKAFNMPEYYADVIPEMLALASYYGPNGSRGEDPEIVRRLTEKPKSSTSQSAKECLNLMRIHHEKQLEAHPDA
ncbi:unnamed protein product [Somion occarium]|uniref:Uncharacterized protein n=1 Tax=Somion occarium TaxID=3059160 RepID=A0ABP1DL80_9APHY